MHEVRNLDKSLVSTVDAYVRAVNDLGLCLDLDYNEIGDDKAPWAKEITNKKGTTHFLDAIVSHNIMSYHTGEETISVALGKMDDSICVDDYMTKLKVLVMNLETFVDDFPHFPDTLVTFYTKEEVYKLQGRLKQVAELEQFIWELNDELDDVYVALVKAKDAYDYNNKLGVYAE